MRSENYLESGVCALGVRGMESSKDVSFVFSKVNLMGIIRQTTVTATQVRASTRLWMLETNQCAVQAGRGRKTQKTSAHCMDGYV